MAIKTHKLAQTLYNIKENFNISDELITQLINSTENPEIINNLDRFIKGYKIEDIYFYLIGCLSKVELVHGLKQEQLPEESKNNYKYQVPDYLCIYKSPEDKLQNLLIDVKSVKDTSLVYSFNKKQLRALYNYSQQLNADMWMAIYWTKLHVITHIPVAFLINKPNSKLKFEEAYMKDFSSMLGDYSFILADKNLFVKTTYKKIENDTSHIQGKYGSIIKEEIAIKKNKYEKIEWLHSAILDSIFKLEEVDVQNNNNYTTAYSNAHNNIVMMKLTSLILRVLVMTHGIETIDQRCFNMTQTYIKGFMEFIKVPISFQIPNI